MHANYVVLQEHIFFLNGSKRVAFRIQIENQKRKIAKGDFPNLKKVEHF
jgi:hypothetical protein